MTDYDWDHGGIYYDKYGNKKWYIWSCDAVLSCNSMKMNGITNFNKVKNRIKSERLQHQSLLDNIIKNIESLQESFLKSNKR